MRIHPIFTQVKDWTGDDKPDGVEALLEFQDQFNDPTKAAGTVIFELYSYRTTSPDPRGERLLNPWVGTLQTLDEQKARWNRTSRTYFFQLEDPMIRADRNYVLCATFDTGGTRFFDQIVLVGEKPAPRGPSTKPSTQPSTQPATQPSTQPAPTAATTMPSAIGAPAITAGAPAAVLAPAAPAAASVPAPLSTPHPTTTP